MLTHGMHTCSYCCSVHVHGVHVHCSPVVCVLMVQVVYYETLAGSGASSGSSSHSSPRESRAATPKVRTTAVSLSDGRARTSPCVLMLLYRWM